MKSRILIVDPDSDVRIILGSYLKHRGYATTTAATPDRALSLALLRAPDLIIGEHPLHLTDGRLLCQALRSDPRTVEVPFIAMTSHALPDEVELAGRTHARVVLKPTLLTELGKVVAGMLHQRA